MEGNHTKDKYMVRLFFFHVVVYYCAKTTQNMSILWRYRFWISITFFFSLCENTHLSVIVSRGRLWTSVIISGRWVRVIHLRRKCFLTVCTKDAFSNISLYPFLALYFIHSSESFDPSLSTPFFVFFSITVVVVAAFGLSCGGWYLRDNSLPFLSSFHP